MKIINVVSGKGGTGKTLLVAVLAELLAREGKRALLVDVDIFVRGLTCLLYYQQDRRTRLLDKKEVSVSEILIEDEIATTMDAGIVPYRAFGVWPAVRRIDDDLDFHNVMPNDFDESKIRIQNLLSMIRSDWDIVFLDCRSGFDELLAAIHSISDITLNVQEDDLIAGITSDNLKSQLSRVPAQTPVYSLTNKSRASRIVQSDDNNVRNLGRIPFDADVRASYGREDFWTSITASLIEPSLIEIWNTLCRNEHMDELHLRSHRKTAIPNLELEIRMGRLVTQQRIFAIYGLILGLGGGLLGLGGRDLVITITQDPIRFIGILMGIFGIIMAFLSMSNTIYKDSSRK